MHHLPPRLTPTMPYPKYNLLPSPYFPPFLYRSLCWSWSCLWYWSWSWSWFCSWSMYWFWYWSMSLSLSPSLFHPALSRGRTSPTISSSPVLLDITGTSDIASVSAELQYNGRRYSGVEGHTIPPPTAPMPSLPRLAVGITNFPSYPYLASSSPDGGPPCGGICPESSHSWGTLRKSLLWTGVLTASLP